MEEIAIEHIVQQLASIRESALQQRQRLSQPPKLPARKALGKCVDWLAASLFPNRLGDSDIQAHAINFYVGTTLDKALRELQQQVRLELAFKAPGSPSSQFNTQAHAITHAFAEQLPHIRLQLDTDLEAAYQGDPAADSVDEILVSYPGILALIHYRIAHVLHGLGLTIIARLITEIAHSQTGIDIHPGAQIGDHFFIDHGTGVVIGETAIIGSHVRLYQAVTLGAKNFPKDANGHLVKKFERHPILEDYVVVYAGATILGRITIGKHSIIGGNVWVTRSVPANSHVTQAHSDAKPIPVAA
ncbi:serine O-acetyltransferase EpsC [Methylophilus sp. QUAN]|uniref:serine O-acetyltransferase EpsC n=1 Tax=Methylophilus sp. QUAN TaxID=2781020 RepID=UPI00189003D5|nr:serine O-acetyltransferase EpsC [Methylophilus sp. QUAN]MBF4991514.1 serine acetyltransferase [Methylophilus sp. QUAN]